MPRCSLFLCAVLPIVAAGSAHGRSTEGAELQVWGDCDAVNEILRFDAPLRLPLPRRPGAFIQRVHRAQLVAPRHRDM